MSKTDKNPGEIRVPKNAVSRLNLGQSFAEYDKLLDTQGVFVTTPAITAALDDSRSKCFFVGRRGTGKTAITRYLAKHRPNVIHIHPQIFPTLGSTLNLEDLRDARQRPFHSLVACFKRAIADEVLGECVAQKKVRFEHAPSELRQERNYIEDFDFDTRTLALVQEIFGALRSNNDQRWLRLMNRAKQVVKSLDDVAVGKSCGHLILIDRIDDTWDGSDTAVTLLMALMHACVELASSLANARPLLFLRENILDRVRQMDNEFTRLETCVVSLDWTRELLRELIERRLQLVMNPKPPLGEVWDYLFEKVHGESSQAMVFDYCQRRPRDMIIYSSFAVESAQAARHERILIEDLQNARRRFSESALKDLGDEYSENFPQIQLVLGRFHGLAREFTVPAIGAFIQKLLTDGQVTEFCKSWIFRYTAPHNFVELLYGIGFLGVKNQDVVDFRSLGARSAPPPIEANSHVVVHPSYVEALDLQDKVIGTLDDVTLQKEGLLIDLPDAVDLRGYKDRLTQLLADIENTPTGDEYDRDYERIVGDIIGLCFFRVLCNVEPQVRDVDGRVIRDWVASNVASSGFWEMIRERYLASQVIWECKNYTELTAGDFHQTAYYMGNAIGHFSVVCFRGERSDKSHYYQHIRRIASNHNGMVLLLTDKDLQVFVRQSLNGKVKEEHIRDIYDTTVRKIS